LAIHGAKMDWKGRGIRSPSEKRFLRKSWVSETWMIGETTDCGMRVHLDAENHTVDGPPMLSITIAILMGMRSPKRIKVVIQGN
jgi:hypothetical protein